MSNIFLKQYGSGSKTFVCFPGWTYPIEKEPNFLKLLSKKYKVVSVHLPGYLNNPDATSWVNFSSLVKDISSELKKIKINQPIFLGFSMGCQLIMEFDKLFPNINKKIFMGYSDHNYKIPIWGKILLSNNFFINKLRKNKKLKKLIVNKAIKIANNDSSSIFKKDFISLTGSFDSLIGLIKSKTNISPYKNKALFIYGENDHHLKLENIRGIKNISLIKKAGHNCAKNHEKEVTKAIENFI